MDYGFWRPHLVGTLHTKEYASETAVAKKMRCWRVTNVIKS